MRRVNPQRHHSRAGMLRRLLICPIATTLFVVNCGGDAVDPSTEVMDLMLFPAQVTLEGWGMVYRFEVRATLADGRQTTGLPLSWTSSDTSVARVSNGEVHTVTDGTTTITARLNTLSASATLTVAQRPNRIDIELPRDSLTLGDTVRAVATVRDAGGTLMPTEPVSWDSDTPFTVTVDSTGLVRAIRGGWAQITAWVRNGARTAWAEMTVADTAFRARIWLGGKPWHVAQSSTGVVYVTQLESGQVSRLSVSPPGIAKTIDVGAGPTRVAFTPDGQWAFVSLETESAIAIIDVPGDSVIHRYAVDARPYWVAPMPDSTAYFLSSWGAGFTTCFFRLFPDSNEPIQPIPLGGNWQGVVRDHTRPRLYVSGISGLQIYRTDLQAFGASLPGGAAGLVVTPDGKYLLTISQGLLITDLATRELVGRVDGADGLGITVSEDGQRAWVTPNATSYIPIVDLPNQSVRRYMYADGALAYATLVGDTLLIASDQDGWVYWLRAER